jgi:ferric iron reductase protein FhuF
MLGVLRESLLDAHLAPLVEAIHARVKVGTRTLLGSVSSGIAYGVLRTAGVVSGSTGPASTAGSVEAIGTLLRALDLDDLIELVPGPSGEPTVRRKTCCLAFALPESKICAGCCIKAPRAAGLIGPAHPRRSVTA